MSNKYFKGAKVSEGTFRRIVRCFADDQTATVAAQTTGVLLRSVNPIFLRIRERIAEFGDVELHAPSIQARTFRFGPKGIRGPRGRGAGRKTIVLVLYGGDDKVFLEVVPNETKATIYPIMQSRLSLETEIRTNGMWTFHGLSKIGFTNHIPTKGEIPPFREQPYWHGAPEIQQFWWATERSLKKFLGLPMGTRRLHLKERAFRHNMQKEDLYQVLLELLRTHPL
jgi:transposase-like protein